MSQCTMFRNFTVPIANETLNDISIEIASDKHKAVVEKIRTLIQIGKSKEANTLKQSLLAFTPSATFKERRLLESLDQYSNFIHLDFDNLAQKIIEVVFLKICKIPCTFLCFRSPSGKGLKVFIRVNIGAEHHALAYKQVREYYESQLGIKSDTKCKDITRLCFVSYDPLLYKNISSEEFEVLISQKKSTNMEANKVVQNPVNKSDWTPALEQCLSFTEQKEQYKEGNRNQFIYLFASNANRLGLPQDETLSFCLAKYDLDEREIKSTINSAYSHHVHEFAKSAKPAKVTNTMQDSTEDFLKNTPTIPVNLYERMPDILKRGALAFANDRERDVFLTSALSVLSGSMANVKGVYDGHEVYANVYSFSIAPPASGKGALKFAKMLGDQYHDYLVANSREAEKKYAEDIEEYRAQKQAAKKNGGDIEEAPPKPTFKILFIPANTSYAKVLSHIEQNGGLGIICETEADTMGNVFKQDWGGYSDMLRKAFHHERISSSRKTNNEFIEVDQPRLSVSLTGTPGQVAGLISSSEDGLFSRFLFYAFKVNQSWKDVSPGSNKINLTSYFKELSKEVFQMIKFLEMEETLIELSGKQWHQLNSVCEAWLKDVTVFTSESAASIVKRLGLIIYRISMLFTAMRKHENAEVADKVMCTDGDFEIAVQLADIYLKHSLLMFNNLPKQTAEIYFRGGNNKRDFFNSLPDEFSRQQAVQAALPFNISPRSVDELLRNMLNVHLTQPKTGFYKKK